MTSRFANSPTAAERAFGADPGDQTVLVVAPHPDDEALGCGGAIVRHAGRGDRVHVLFLTSGEQWREDLQPREVWAIREPEAERAAAVLGVAQTSFLRHPDWHLGDDIERAVANVSAAIEEDGPDVVYAPHPAEWHPDHRAASTIALDAARRCGLEPTALLRYEVWTPLTEFEVVADISDVMERKLDALAQYRSQLSAFDYVRAAKGLASFRGALVTRSRYAEVFARHRR